MRRTGIGKNQRSRRAADSRNGFVGLPYLAAAAAAVLFLGGGFFLGQRLRPGTGSDLLGTLGSLVSETFGRRTPVFELSLDGRGSRSGTLAETNLNTPCTPASSTLVRDRIVISEVAWMGTVESATNEWIELANTSEADADISGWRLRDAEAQIDVVFPRGTVLSGGSFFLLERKEAATPAPSGALYAGSLRNSDESLRLYDHECTLVDEVAADPAWPAGDNASKRTMERNLSDLSWRTATVVGGTPGTANSKPPASVKAAAVLGTSTASTTPAVPVLDPADASVGGASSAAPQPCAQDNLGAPLFSVIINEVAWAGVGSGRTADEWIELRNPSRATVLLSGWQLVNKARTLHAVFGDEDVISPGSFFLLERTDDATIPTIPADKMFTGAIKNNDESLRLFDERCRLIDEVVAGSRWPAGTASPDYRTAERSPDLSWHTYAYAPGGVIFGTPRWQNSEPVFVPDLAAPSGSELSPAPQSQAAAPEAGGRVLISEVMVGSDASAADEFIELYNPTDYPVDLTGWMVKKKTSTGSESSLVVASRFDGRSIGAGKYLLLANEGGYDDAVPFDVGWPSSYTVAYTNNSVALYGAGGGLIDEVSWAEIPKNQSIVRDSWEASSFSVHAVPTPQNSSF